MVLARNADTLWNVIYVDNYYNHYILFPISEVGKAAPDEYFFYGEKIEQFVQVE